MDDILALIAKAPDTRQRDAHTLLDLMTRVTDEQPYLWSSIVSFGSYHYIYATGRQGDAPAAGFSPRKAATTIYLADGVDTHTDALAQLGPHTVGKGCLYIKDLEKVDLGVLEQIIRQSYRTVSTPGFAQHGAGE